MNSKAKSVLIAEDDEDIGDLIREIISSTFPDIKIIQTSNGVEALQRIKETKLNLLCLDQRMPYISGVEIVNDLRSQDHAVNRDTPVIFITGFMKEVKKQIRYTDNIYFLSKPFDGKNLLLSVDFLMVTAHLDILELNRELSEKEKNLKELNEKLIVKTREALFKDMSHGIAHLINNPNAIISGNIELIKRNLETKFLDDKRMKNIVGSIENSVGRVTEIISILRAVSDFSKENYNGHIRLSILTDQSIGEIQKKYEKTGVEFKLVGVRPDMKVYCNAREIEFVLMSLLDNAYWAAKISQKPDSENGWVSMEIKENDEIVMIAVSDSGAGVPEELRDKIFDIFFSTDTKKHGLGLSISGMILSKYGSRLILDKDSPHTRFMFYLKKNQQTALIKSGGE